MARIIEFDTGSYKVETEVINSNSHQLHVRGDLVGIYNIGTGKYVNGQLEDFSEWIDPSANPYASLSSLLSDLKTFFPFFFDVSGSSGSGWSGEVDTFAELPTAGAENDGQVYLVKTSTGSQLSFNLRRSGFYVSNGSVWNKLSNAQVLFTDDELTFRDDLDNTKQVGFQLSQISTGTRRTLTFPDKNFTIGEDRNTVKLIQTVSDLLRIHTPVGNVIELTFPIYEIDSENLDLGVYTLTASRDITLKGISQGNNKISTTQDNSDLITVTNGNLFVIQLELEASGLNSQAIVMNGTSNESLDMQYVEFSSGTKFGTLTDIRQGFWTNGFSFGAREGFTLDGSFGGFTLFESRIINCGNFILGAGASLSIENVRSNVNATVAAGSFAFDFDFEDFTADGGYLIQGGRFDGDGEMLAPFTDGLADRAEAEKSTRSFMRDNSGDKGKNTRPGIAYGITAEILTPLTVNVPSRLLGTATYSKQEHWSDQNDNVLTYIDQISADFTLFYSLLIDGGPNDVVRVDIRKYDDLVTTTDFTVIGSVRRSIPNSQGGLDVANFIIPVPDIKVNFEERVEIWVTNETDGTDVTLKIGSEVFVRPS